MWLQDISGFDIGVEAERQGLLGYGSSLIYTNSTNRVPMFTVLLRKASGAGYYAMAGMPYEPVVQLSTPIARLSVMEGRTLAIAAFNTKLDDDFRDRRDRSRRSARRSSAACARPRRASRATWIRTRRGQMDTDEIVALGELRDWLELFAEASYQAIGYRRIKNPRIWSLHDLARAHGAARLSLAQRLDLLVERDGSSLRLLSPGVGYFTGGRSVGDLVAAGAPAGVLLVLGRAFDLSVPDGVEGRVVSTPPLLARQPVGWGDSLYEIDPAAALDGDGGRAPSGAPVSAGEPAGAAESGTFVVRSSQSGRFYLRPAPGEAPFVEVGGLVEVGHPIGLIEVMKTFAHVRYAGADMPARARVTRIVVADGAEIGAGDPLLEVEPA